MILLPKARREAARLAQEQINRDKRWYSACWITLVISIAAALALVVGLMIVNRS